MKYQNKKNPKKKSEKKLHNKATDPNYIHYRKEHRGGSILPAKKVATPNHHFKCKSRKYRVEIEKKDYSP